MMALDFNIPPQTEEDYIKALRASLMDFPELNHILLDRDNSEIDFTDTELLFAIHRGLADINQFPPATQYTISSFPSPTHWNLLLDWATIRLLESKAILKIRNDMAYQDDGGVTVDMRGKGQEFMQIVNHLYARAYEGLRIFKATISVLQGYGSIPSPYGYANFGW